MKNKFLIASGIFVVIVAVVLVLVFVIKPAAPDYIKEPQVKYLADISITQPAGNEYIVFFYLPTCTHCEDLMASSAYADFLQNPGIRFYRVNINNGTYGGAINTNLPIDFETQVNITGTPTLMLIKHVSGDNYVIMKKVVGTPDAETLLEKYTAK